jgi:hypothetical protein
MKYFIIVVFLVARSVIAFSQVEDKVDLKKIEDSLKVLGKIILNGETDFIKYHGNESFLKLMEGALISKNSFDYHFDSLITIARLRSEDNKLRVLNWLLRKTDGTYEYFGFLQAWNNKQKKYTIYQLRDYSDSINSPETRSLSPLNWYGALYYKIISCKSHGKKCYTLLGWDGNNNVSQKKIIDVIYINSNDKPVFGASIFKYNKKLFKRIIFEYNSTVSMSLKYEKQFLESGKKRRPMIIFDRISPLAKGLEGMYQYYYPETNIFDAFIFRNGKWEFIKDIDARNAPETKEERKHRQTIIKEQKKHKSVVSEKITDNPYFAH